MVQIDNIFGKQMQIRFSKLYLHQDVKQEINSGISVTRETELLIDSVRNLSLGTDLNINKAELYALFFSLGKVAYGEKGLAYINQLLPNGMPKITEAEIVYHNLKKIFKSFDTTIGMEVYNEFCEIYDKNKTSQSKEIEMLKKALLLEKISLGVTKSFLINDNELEYTLAGTKLKLEEIEKMKKTYKITQKFELTPKMKELLPKVEKLYANYDLSSEEKEELEVYIEETIKTSKSRSDLLDAVYLFNSRITKKKVRGK